MAASTDYCVVNEYVPQAFLEALFNIKIHSITYYYRTDSDSFRSVMLETNCISITKHPKSGCCGDPFEVLI